MRDRRMGASMRKRSEELASEIAGPALTTKDLANLMRPMTASACVRMLDGEMDVYLGRMSPGGAAGESINEPPDAAEIRRVDPGVVSGERNRRSLFGRTVGELPVG